jgi:hypothetical protein
MWPEEQLKKDNVLMNAFLHVDDSEHWIKTFIALGLVSRDWKTSGRRSMGSTAVMSLSRGSFPEAAREMASS